MESIEMHKDVLQNNGDRQPVGPELLHTMETTKRTNICELDFLTTVHEEMYPFEVKLSLLSQFDFTLLECGHSFMRLFQNSKSKRFNVCNAGHKT